LVFYERKRQKQALAFQPIVPFYTVDTERTGGGAGECRGRAGRRRCGRRRRKLGEKLGNRDAGWRRTSI
jgi:hypothetical protein